MVIRVPDQRPTPGGYAALDDRLLVLDFQAGNPQAFVEIHRRYGGLARRVCHRFLPQQQDADEAFQETMIRVFQGLYKFNGRYALQPWIARIAKNVSLDTLRGRARRPQTDDSAPASDELPVPGDEADEIVERLVQRDTVLAVLADLPETQRCALVLRELDGRSHREVAQELEISTSQAKALIHRAKVSFRKRWLEKVTERGGFMAIAFLPLMWLIRIGDGLRRVGVRLGHSAQVAQAAVPEAVSSAVGTTAAPAVSSGVGERVVAAGMTLLLAGGVTVGAAKIVKDRNHHEAPAPAAAAAGEAQPTPKVHVAPSPVHHRVFDAARTGDAGQIRAEPPIVGEPDPSAVAEASPSVSPSPTVEPSPSPEVSPSPEPTVTPPPPAPEWGMDFASDLLGETTALSLDTSTVEGSAGKNTAFSQSVTGTLKNGKGRSTGVQVEYWGATGGSNGLAHLRFSLDTPAGTYEYEATAALTSLGRAEDGTTVYTFMGGYSLSSAPDVAEAGMPHDGVITLELSFWSDRTSLYLAAMGLAESTG